MSLLNSTHTHTHTNIDDGWIAQDCIEYRRKINEKKKLYCWKKDGKLWRNKSCAFVIVVVVNDDDNFDSVPVVENLLQILGLLIPASLDLSLIKSSSAICKYASNLFFVLLSHCFCCYEKNFKKLQKVALMRKMCTWMSAYSCQ